MKSKGVESNSGATKQLGGVTGKGFMPGQSGSPGGRVPVPPEVRKALAADTLEHYEEAKRLIALAEETGDLKTALTGRLALLRKTVPDASELIISIPEGVNVRTLTIDPRKLSKEQLAAIHAAQTAARE